MPGKRGQRWGERRKAAFVQNGPPPTRHIVDPDGEPTLRCRVCGLPSTKDNPVYPGLWGYIRQNVPLNLCDRCVWAMTPEEEPVRLEDAA